MQGILIDPKNKTVTTCEVDDVAPLQSLYTRMRCSYIEQVYIGGGEVLLVNEDGKLNYPNKDGYFLFNCMDCVFAGCSVVLRDTGREWASTQLSLEEAAGMVEWCTPTEAQVKPRAFIFSW